MSDTQSLTDEMWPRRRVEQFMGCSRMMIYRQMKSGNFPRPRRIGSRKVVWSASEVRAWVAARPKAA